MKCDHYSEVCMFVAYEGPSIPTNPSPKKVVKQETKESTDKEQTNFQGSTAHILPPVNPIPIPKPGVLKTLPKPNIPYPSRRNNQKSRDKASNQMEKIFQIFQDLRFDISFVDALLLMPRFAPTIKSLLMNKEKFLELAKIPLNENCSMMLLKKLPRKASPKSLKIPANFDADPRVPLILGRSFLRTGRALIDVYGEEITLRVDNEAITFNLDQTTRYSSTNDKSVNRIDIIDEAKSSMEEPPELELKDLPSHLEYAYLEENDKLPVIIAKGLKEDEKEALLKVLKSHKRAIAWKITDIKDAPGTFQWCMMAIFYDMIEKTMEGLLDDFSIWGRRRIVLGPKIISKSGIEGVDRVKVEVDAKLPHPTTVKGTYELSSGEWIHRLCFSKDCIDAFETLKKKLTEAPILVVPDWNLPFELMCDASDFAIGAVLGQRKTKHFQPIHYASKTMTEAQIHYTTTEKEMLVVVYAFEKFRPYLVLSKSIVYTDHSALKYLMNKQDAKPRIKIIEGVCMGHEANDILKACHEGPTEGHQSANLTARKDGLEKPCLWSDKLDDAFMGIRIPLLDTDCCTPYKFVYGKTFHLPIELEHKAYWALKHANFDLQTAAALRYREA
ncbi:reverse transcriptase domain-containing protein [Tanacetum coccineum]